MTFQRLALTLDNDGPITDSQFRAIEKFADQLFAKIGLDIRFTKHFKERVNDARNQQQVTIRELATFFHDAYKQHGPVLDELPAGMEGVLADKNTFINMPFAIDFNPRSRELELVSKTLMRKRNFQTPSRKFVF